MSENPSPSECVIKVGENRYLCCPAFPKDCDYVRIVEDGEEIAYWDYMEWEQEPQEVMGAIMGAANEGRIE